MNEEDLEKIKIGISSCLMGEQVRFDSGHKRNAYINGILSSFFEFTSFCPEVDIGLGIPREPIRLVSIDDDVRCVGVKTPDLDVTEDLYRSADEQQAWQRDLCGYILKKGSPSCGMERARLYKGDIPDRTGVGLYAARLMQNFPDLPVEEEGRLEDPVLRENFIQRVYIYSRWHKLMDQPVSMKTLSAFHARHKYIYMSHNQGYLKNHLDADDKRELTININQYREGLLPLIVSITLLRHHFRRHPHNYIGDSYYMQPHPAELMLLNNL